MEIIQNETNVGLVRKNNEDVALTLRHPKDASIILLLVADGMGGKSYGELASSYVAKSIEKWFKSKSPKKLTNLEDVESTIETHIKKMNNELIKKYGKNVAGTTLTLTLVTKSGTLFVNVGDSRGYIYKKKKLIQITQDASDVWYYYVYGAAKKDDLRFFYNNNIITSCIGLTEDLCTIETQIIDNDYDMILLFTDGVTDIITDKKLLKLIKKHKKKEILSKIIHEAVYIDQNLHIPHRLKVKKYSKYILPFKGRDNATGAIYIKDA